MTSYSDGRGDRAQVLKSGPASGKAPRDAMAGWPEPECASAARLCLSAFVSTGFFSFLINILMLAGPLFMLQVYDRVLTSRSVPTLVALFAVVAVLFIFMGLFDIIRARILCRMGRRLEEQVGPVVFESVMKRGLDRGNPGPGVASNIQPFRDLDVMRQFTSGPSLPALFDIPWSPCYLAILYLMHTSLGLLASGGAIVLLLFAGLNEVATRRPLTKAGQWALASQGFAAEACVNCEAVHAMGMKKNVERRWLRLSGQAYAAQSVSSDVAGAISAASRSTRLILQSAMLALGAFLAIYGEISAGAMIAASIIMSRALAPLDQSIAHWRGFLEFRRALERISILTKAC